MAHVNQSVIEKFYFNARHAENNMNAALIQRAILKADIAAFRRICATERLRDVAEPIIEGLFGGTGSQLPYIDPKSLLPTDQDPSPNEMN